MGRWGLLPSGENGCLVEYCYLSHRLLFLRIKQLGVWVRLRNWCHCGFVFVSPFLKMLNQEVDSLFSPGWSGDPVIFLMHFFLKKWRENLPHYMFITKIRSLKFHLWDTNKIMTVQMWWLPFISRWREILRSFCVIPFTFTDINLNRGLEPERKHAVNVCVGKT